MKNITIIFSIIFALIFLLYRSPTAVNSQTDHVVITEIQVAGDNATDEFVELYNPTSETVDLTGWSLKRATSNMVASMSGTIQPYGFYLIAHDDYTVSISADESYSLVLGTNSAISLFNDAEELIDRVGFGSASLFETSAIDAPAASQSVERKAKETSDSESMGVGGDDELLGNGHDTDNNSNDFVLREDPQPQNSTADVENPTIITPIPTEIPTATPTESVTPTSSPTPTNTPTSTLTPSPTNTPTPTEARSTPTPSPEPTVEPKPTPTPFTRTIGVFNFPGRTTVCQIQYQQRSFGFITLFIPNINCFNL